MGHSPRPRVFPVGGSEGLGFGRFLWARSLRPTLRGGGAGHTRATLPFSPPLLAL